MPPNKQEPTRLELYKAGKLEERRSERVRLAPTKEVSNVIEEEEEQQSFRLRPTAIALALMVILLLVLSVTGL